MLTNTRKMDMSKIMSLSPLNQTFEFQSFILHPSRMSCSIEYQSYTKKPITVNNITLLCDSSSLFIFAQSLQQFPKQSLLQLNLIYKIHIFYVI